jgi:beta-N-acetylhexosaminidase
MCNLVEEILSKLTLEQKIGQMICIGLNTTYADDEFKDLISKYPFGAVGLFNRNIDNVDQVRSLTDEIQNLVTPQCCGLTAMIALDEEGGIVSQFSSDITQTPGNFAIGATDSEDFAFNCGHITGLELSEIGINMNWAPVIDLNTNPLNKTIDIRAFGDNAELVSKLGVSTLKGLHAGGVGATGKHFPGHGNAITNLNMNLLINYNDEEHLFKNDFYPFNKVSEAGIDAVMVAPIALPSIDKGTIQPATISNNIITHILRDKLKFDGVVMVDDLNTQNTANNYTLKRAAQLSISAGADMIILCHSKPHQIIVFNSLLNAVNKGRLKIERINESVKRIIRMKLNCESYINNKISLSVFERNQIVEHVCADSIVLLADPKGLIPLDKSVNRKALVVLPKLISFAFADTSEFIRCNLGEHLSTEFYKTKIISINPFSVSSKEESDIEAASADSDIIIIATENAHEFPVFLNLIHKLNKIKPTIIVSLRHPYEVKFFPKDASIILAFSPTNKSMEAVKNVITGRLKAKGKAPITLGLLNSSMES